MQRLHLAIGSIVIALATPVFASPPNDGRIRLAQAKPDTCASDRETIESLKKDNDRDTVRLMLKDIQCDAVRQEGQKWLDQPASAPPVARPADPPPAQPPQREAPKDNVRPTDQQQPPQQQQPPVRPAQPALPPVQPPPIQPAQPAQPPPRRDVAGPSMQEARDLGRLATGRIPLRESFIQGDRSKFYRFEVAATSIIIVIVDNMSTDMRIVLQDGNGRLVGEQSRRGRFNNKEEYYLDVARPAGVYFVSVENMRGDSSPFDLTIETISPAPPYSHQDMALRLPVGGGRQPTRFTFGDRTQFRYAEFEVARPGLYKLHQRTVSSDGNTDIDLILHRIQGPNNYRQLASSDRGGDAPETLVEFLDAGRYVVQMKRHEGYTAEVELTIQPTNELISPLMTENRTFDEQGDWKAYEVNNSGRKRCFAYTVAKSFTPEEQWRGVRPVLFIRVDEDQDAVDHSFDRIRFYNTGAKWRGAVSGGSGAPPNIPFDIVGPDVETREPCQNDRSRLCISRDGLKALTRGHQLVLSGTTPDGRASTVTYSLMGYQRIIKSINDRCNARAQWLIVR